MTEQQVLMSDCFQHVKYEFSVPKGDDPEGADPMNGVYRVAITPEGGYLDIWKQDEENWRKWTILDDVADRWKIIWRLEEWKLRGETNRLRKLGEMDFSV